MPKTTCAFLAALLAAVAMPAFGLSVQGYASAIAVPVVVETASYASQITIQHDDLAALSVRITYHPAIGTPAYAPGASFACQVLTLPPTRVAHYTLGQLCPVLGPGSQYGWLELVADPTLNGNLLRRFSVYTRVQNPQGNGFSVEGFPLSAFGSAVTYVSGLKRQSAAPGYQSNCFVMTRDGPVRLYVALRNNVGSYIASANVDVPAGTLLRFLDIVAYLGLPAGDYDDLNAFVAPDQGYSVADFAFFCTLQNNTTFDADFRIGKQRAPRSDFAMTQSFINTRDDYPSRFVVGSPPRGLTTSSLRDVANLHVVYLSAPDVVSCWLGLDEANLEMLFESEAGDLSIGGRGTTSFGPVYIPKDNSLRNGRHYIRVQNRARPGRGGITGWSYTLTCATGSGSTRIETLMDDYGPGAQLF